MNEQEKLALALNLADGLQSKEATIAKNNKLESIFIPHARRRRDELYKENTSGFLRFVHYTSAESALKIIQQKRLWMRSAACMADYREVQHGFDILQRYFSDDKRMKVFTDLIHSFAMGAAHKAIINFNQWWSSGNILFKTYIASMSEHDDKENIHGRLSMWRAFGGNGARVGVVFKVPKYSAGADAMRLIFSPVAYYENNEADDLIPEVIRNIQANQDFLRTLGYEEVSNWIFHMLLVAVSCIKHPGFREEREWRAVHNPILFPTGFIKPVTVTVGGVPQVVYDLPLDKAVDPILDDLDFPNLFNHLIIGPTAYPVAMFDAFNEALSKAGVPDAGAKIVNSDIPIRHS
jgi:hypothetical protein